MENATKALMIAGAVLIAIMIIGVGMAIFSNGQKVIDDAQGGLQDYASQQFNSPFEAYEGNKKGSEIKQLISKISTSNANNEGINDDKIITFNGKTTPNDLATERAAIVSGKTYTISLQYKNGLVSVITCTEVTNKQSGT